jgi:hypothetical protein
MMSRYTLEPLLPEHEIVIGWDRPLANFFLQVRDLTIAEDDDTKDPIIVWLGADDYASEMDVESVLAEARRWAAVPDDLQSRLLCDQRANPAGPPSPLPVAMTRRRS